MFVARRSQVLLALRDGHRDDPPKQGGTAGIVRFRLQGLADRYGCRRVVLAATPASSYVRAAAQLRPLHSSGAVDPDSRPARMSRGPSFLVSESTMSHRRLPVAALSAVLMAACAAPVPPSPAPAPVAVAAPAPAPLPPSGPIPTDFYGTFQGTYVCAQGETGVQLILTRGDGPNAVNARFNFYPTSGNAGVASGSYTLAGETKPNGMLVLEPVKWVKQPMGYSMVGVTLRPEVRNGMITGVVNDPGCDWIRVRRA